jgi:hypothetical protein
MYRLQDWITTLALAFLMLIPATVQGQTLTVAWDPSPEAEAVSGYEVCIGTSSFSCSVTDAMVGGDQTSFAFTPTPGLLHYVAIRAMNVEGQSAFSSEVTVSVPSLSPISDQANSPGTAIAPLTISASDPDGSPFSSTQTGLPPGLTLNLTTRVIGGTPTTVGTYNVTVSVWDGLGGDSRTFTWTIGQGTTPSPAPAPSPTGGDATPPVILISSHAPGQTVTVGTIIVSGTATDGGAGGNGIALVTVNGQPTTGGTATGSNPASWSRAVSVVAGSTPVVTVEAQDGAGNVRTAQLALTLAGSTPAPAPMTGASLAMDRPSPQPVGTPVTFSATGSGGVTPYQFRWYARLDGQPWAMVQNWGTQSTYTWTAAHEGNYTVAAWGRSAGVTSDAWQGYAERAFAIGAPTASTPPPVSGVTLVSDVRTLQVVGTRVGFTASASGGASPYQYQWSLQRDGNAPQIVLPWSTSGTYAWTPLAVGVYTISVAARSAGVTASVPQAAALMVFAITAPPSAAPASVSSLSLSTDVLSPQNTGTAVTFAAAALGGVAPYQYQWFVEDASGNNQLARSWSASSAFSWTPTQAGSYGIVVWARSAGVTADALQAQARRSFAIASPVPVSPVSAISPSPSPAPSTAPSPTPVSASSGAPAPVAVVLVTDRPSPQAVGAPVILVGAAVGGVRPYQYVWYAQKDGQAQTTLKDWGGLQYMTWLPTAPGTYRLTVGTRSAGVTASTPQTTGELVYVVTGVVSTPLAIAASLSSFTLPGPLTTQFASAGAAVTTTLLSNPSAPPQTASLSAQQDLSAPISRTPLPAQPEPVALPPAPPSRAAVTAVSLTADRSTPLNVGATTTVTAVALGGTAPYEYQWYVSDGNNGAWKVARPWSATATFQVSPNAVGVYGVGVWARSAGAVEPQAYAERRFSAVAGRTAAASMTNKPSGQQLGTRVLFTAAGTGGVERYQYRFWLRKDGGPWQSVRTWNEGASVGWTPRQPGAYDLAIWARSAGATADEPQAYAERAFVIRERAPLAR